MDAPGASRLLPPEETALVPSASAPRRHASPSSGADRTSWNPGNPVRPGRTWLAQGTPGRADCPGSVPPSAPARREEGGWEPGQSDREDPITFARVPVRAVRPGCTRRGRMKRRRQKEPEQLLPAGRGLPAQRGETSAGERVALVQGETSAGERVALVRRSSFPLPPLCAGTPRPRAAGTARTGTRAILCGPAGRGWRGGLTAAQIALVPFRLLLR